MTHNQKLGNLVNFSQHEASVYPKNHNMQLSVRNLIREKEISPSHEP